jgi:hypothetical protein
LKTREALILRVEARTPNDEAGSYHVRFGGSFAPFSGGIPVADNTEAPEDRPSGGGKRLSSVGATIAEPVVETPPPAAEPKPAAAIEKPAEGTAPDKKTIPPKAVKTRPTKPATVTRNSRGRARPAKPKPATSDTEAAKTAATKTEGTKPEEAKKETGAVEEKTSAASSAKSEPAKPAAQELPPAGAHLIIESKDGTKIDRPMSTVRRVVVEGGMIVIVLKTGKIERVPMSAVARMAIEP